MANYAEVVHRGRDGLFVQSDDNCKGFVHGTREGTILTPDLYRIWVSWTCGNGHETEVLIQPLDGGKYALHGGSHLCDHCMDVPSKAQARRMWSEVMLYQLLERAQRAGMPAHDGDPDSSLVRYVEVSEWDGRREARRLIRARRRIMAVCEAERIRKLAHLSSNRAILVESGIMSSPEDVDSYQAIVSRMIDVGATLQTCDLLLRRPFKAVGSCVNWERIRTLAAEGERAIASLDDDHVPGAFTIYAGSKRLSLDRMKVRLNEIREGSDE